MTTEAPQTTTTPPKLEAMTAEEYVQIQQNLVLMAGLVAGLKLDAFIQRIELASAVGPVLAPELFVAAGDTLAAFKKMAVGLREFQRSLPSEMKRPLHMAPVPR
jgi:hypothetical protein